MLQDECSDAVENSVDLISMLFNIADIPPAVKERMGKRRRCKMKNLTVFLHLNSRLS